MLRRALLAALIVPLAACDGDPGRIRTGPEVFRLQGCITCHGQDGHGTQMAPDLRVVKTLWTREELVKYVSNAPEYIKTNERLKEQKKRYTLNMPVYAGLRRQEIENVVDYVLALP
ncbi:MAG: cytochrome c [Planctomycetota bacterium]